MSNIYGQMLVADDNGFISRLAPDGSEQELKWISADRDGVTLNAPKGMAIAGDTLHVVDIDHLRTFDAEAGAPLDSLEIEGAKFLNDIAIASDGTRYVTETGTKDTNPARGRVGLAIGAVPAVTLLDAACADALSSERRLAYAPYDDEPFDDEPWDDQPWDGHDPVDRPPHDPANA